MATSHTLGENIGTTQGELETQSTAVSPINQEEKDTTVTNNEARQGEDEVARKRHKSLVWDHFDKLPLEQTNGEPHAKCKYCASRIKCHPTTHGTNGLRKHVARCNKNPNRANKRTQSLLSISQMGSTKSLGHHVINQDQFRRAIAKFIILDEMPFRIVEGEGFKQMMKEVEPRFQIPSRATVTRDCLRLYMQESMKLKRYFKRTKVRVSLTTDTWTSCQNANYMCLTAHWIDEDWNYQKRILNFCVVENHKGDTIASEIERCLLSWNIDKVFTITVDNASSNDNAVEKLKHVFKHWNSLVCNGDFLHLRCCAHISNLIVSDGLKDMHKCIEAIRNAIKYVRSSPSRLHKFKELVEKMKIDSKSLLTMDCPTRWNSVYLMLESAIKFSSVFERMMKDDENYTSYFLEKKLVGPPSEMDFENAKDFVAFLEVFYDITLQFSGSLHVTSNLCFQHIVDVFVILNSTANDLNCLVSNMAQGMQSKYDKYWGNFENLNPLLVIAVILDPRYKMKYLKFAFEDLYLQPEQREAMTKKVTDVLYRLYDHYSRGLDTSQSQTQSQSLTQVASQSATTSSSTQSRLSSLVCRPTMRRFMVESETDNQIDKYAEVEKYLQAELVELLDPNFDILAWWKLNSSKYKVLSLIARDVLAMSVSTVSSESAFSTGGRVIDEYRSSLSSKMVEALICAQNWISPSSLKLKGVDVDNFNDTHVAELEESAVSNMLDEEEASDN